MRFSKKSEYAVRALVCLAAPDAPSMLPIQEISKQEHIPKKFLEQVLLALNKAGLVQSVRGKSGGYALRGAPAAVTLGDIVRAVDGPLDPLPCTNRDAPVKCADCLNLEQCWLRSVMVEVGTAFDAALDHVTLVEMCRRAGPTRQRRSAPVLMYEI